MEELQNQYKYLVGGYYGVSLMDEYPLKEFVLKDIKDYIISFIKTNPIDNYNYREEAILIKDNLSEKVKLQDALIVLNKIHGDMELVFMIKKRLKKYK